MKDILVNQLGFYKNSAKHAVARCNYSFNYDIINTRTGYVIESGATSAPYHNEASGEMCADIDFTSLDIAGKYRIVAFGYESSEFEIKDDVYDAALTKACEFLYNQRCCERIRNGVFSHKACHSDDSLVLSAKKYLDVTGGWHDGADFGRYVVSGAVACEHLLTSYELYGDFYSASLRGVSEKGLPDILAEAAYELDWLLLMQKDDGSVYHKVTSRNNPEMDLRAADDDLDTIICDASYAATADFAAVMAHASRVYQEFDEDRSHDYKQAAEDAFEALEKMEKKPFANPVGILTEEYADEHLEDEHLWALIEMYKLTLDDSLLKKFGEELKNYENKTPSFGVTDVSGFAIYSYLKLRRRSDESYMHAVKLFTDAAAYYKNNMDPDAYDYPYEEYVYGSNFHVLSAGILFLLLADLGIPGFHEQIQKTFDYVLGKNTLGYCYLTGFGDYGVMHPYHRPSVSAGCPLSGMVVAGPDKLDLLTPPASSYEDTLNKETNSVSICFNTAFIFVAAGIIKLR